jgi:hypothetical protein
MAIFYASRRTPAAEGAVPPGPFRVSFALAADWRAIRVIPEGCFRGIKMIFDMRICTSYASKAAAWLKMYVVRPGIRLVRAADGLRRR